MISAKDEFFLEREMLAELQSKIYAADLRPEERAAIYEKLSGEISGEEFEKILLEVEEKTSHPLTKIRNGETLSAKQIKEAVKRAADLE